MKGKEKRRISEGEARYIINVVRGRIDIACKTLDVRRLYAPHRLIFIKGSVLEELQSTLEWLPLDSTERQVADSIIHNNVYDNMPVFTDEIFHNPQLFNIVADVFVMDSSFSQLTSPNDILLTTISPGINTVEIYLHEPPDNGITAGLHKSPHYCFTEPNIMEEGRVSFIPWTKYGFSNMCNNYEDYRTQYTETKEIFFNEIYACKCCYAHFMRTDCLSPSNLKTLFEQRVEVINNG